MIPLWLTPQIARLIGIGAICSILFAGGCITRGKLDASTIERMRRDKEAIAHNYESALQTIGRCGENIKSLEQALSDQNNAIIKMGEDSEAAISKATALRIKAIEHERRSYDESIARMRAEYIELYERWSSLSASDACHQSWLEVTDVQ